MEYPIKISSRYQFIVLFLCLIIISAWFALSRIELETRKNVLKSLFTVAQTTQEALHIWIKQSKSNLKDITTESEVITLTHALLLENNNGQDLVISPSLKKLRKIMANKLEKQAAVGFFIIAPDKISIASMRNENIGSTNIIYQHRKQHLQRAFSGETVFIPTIYSDIPLKSRTGELKKRQPTIFIASPINDDKGNVVAVLTLRLDPASDFTRITQIGRIGDTGETYAFDDKGTLITQSRFDQQLKRIGLIEAENEAMLAIRIADPGGNMLKGFIPTTSTEERPLTFMATNAISGQSFRHLDSYRDYRGVTVLGSWIWDESLNVGLATEIDAKEAMQPYYDTRNTVIAVLFLTVTLALALLFIILKLEKGTKRKLAIAYAKLEEKVEARTKELKESEKKFRTIFESNGDAMILVDESGFIDCNEAALQMFLCKNRKEFLGTHPLKWSSHTQINGSKSSNQLLEEYMFKAFTIGQHDFEWNYVRTDGEVFSSEVRLTSLTMYGKNIIQGSIRDISERKLAERKLDSLNKELEELSYLDGLTGIANRRRFDQTFEIEWRRCQRNQQPLSLMMIDIDLFKQYNDFYGHQQGDNCLISVAKALQSVSKRASDLLARYGGEEFILLLPETSATETTALAKKYLNKVIALQLPHESSTAANIVTISIGISTIIPSTDGQPASLISAADKLLYKAKKSGRNRIETM